MTGNMATGCQGLSQSEPSLMQQQLRSGAIFHVMDGDSGDGRTAVINVGLVSPVYVALTTNIFHTSHLKDTIKQFQDRWTSRQRH